MLASVSKRLQANSDHQREYNEFLREYESLEHMRRARDSSEVPEQIVFIPHHPIIRAYSVTTRLRVVFNASPTSNGASLNDNLFTGPKLQTDVSAVILR